MKKLVSVIAVFTAVFIISGVTIADEVIEDVDDNISIEVSDASQPALPKVTAKSAIVIDSITGRVLYEKNAYARGEMASTTKVMTAIIAIEKGKLDDIVTVSEKAANVWGSKMGLKKGDRYTLENLLYGLMLRSGNDAAIAIAEHIGGTLEGFYKLMNEKALEIGAKNSQFRSPHGLDTPGHYSTAYDLALITRYAIKNPVFNRIVGTVSTSIKGTKGSIDMRNTNEMLSLFKGADGVKTGYTGKAGRCLITSATRENRRLISVVLGCPSRNARASDSSKVLTYAFVNYKNYTLASGGNKIGRIYVNKGMSEYADIETLDTVEYTLRIDEADRVESKYDIPQKINAPVEARQKIGKITFLLDGKEIGGSDVIINSSIERKGFIYYIDYIIRQWRNPLSK